jgi:hypothetical protein
MIPADPGQPLFRPFKLCTLPHYPCIGISCIISPFSPSFVYSLCLIVGNYCLVPGLFQTSTGLIGQRVCALAAAFTQTVISVLIFVSSI